MVAESKMAVKTFFLTFKNKRTLKIKIQLKKMIFCIKLKMAEKSKWRFFYNFFEML
jgi:CYTH domain-containing protein